MTEKTYEQWNQHRRETFAIFNPSFDLITVAHGEYETALYFGNAGGRVVASWYCATGTCSVTCVDDVAEDIGRDVTNYILNAARN